MKTVTIKTMEISNFKGLRSLKIDFSEKGALIAGANEQGKSTVYDAYLWCLFGCTTRQNDCVQPIDEYNNIVHKIETSVTVTLLVDKSQEVKVTRILQEKWKAQGTAEEKFVSAEQKRFYNDVPCGQAELTSKLDSIFPTKQWLMLSNIRTFMEQSMDDRRKILKAVANIEDESNIAAKYPLVSAAIAKGKTLPEFEKQLKDTKKRAEAIIKDIPKRIDAQDKLRVDEDFDALRKQKQAIDAQIADIEKLLQASPEEMDAERKRKEAIAKAEKEYNDLRKKWNDEHFEKCQQLNVTYMSAKDEYEKACQEQERNTTANSKDARQLETLKADFNESKQAWLSVNAEDFEYKDIEVCPCCGHRLTEEEKLTFRNDAVSKFNASKAERLGKLYNECCSIKTQISVLSDKVKIYTEKTQQEDATYVLEKKKALDDAEKAKTTESAIRIESNEEIARAKETLDKILNASSAPVDSDVKKNAKLRRSELFAQRDDIIKRLSGEQTNANIDKEKVRLNEEARKQAQIVADCDNAFAQVRKYKKELTEYIEASVNKFFHLVNWKFSEVNKTNDDEKQLCTPLYKGIEYNRQNYASQVNMGVDICEGLMRGYDVRLPLFVDNTESVCKLLDADSQIITLRVVPEEKLLIKAI